MIVVHTILVIIEQAFLYFPLVLGAYISISLMKLPDLSIESAYVFGAIMATKILPLHEVLPSWLLFICVIGSAIIGGLAVGCVSSFFTQFAKVPHLLSSILTVGLFHGISQFVLGSANVSLASYLNPLTASTWLPSNPEIPVLFGAFIILFLLGFLFLKTQLGYSLFVFGNNQRFFENYGISKVYIGCVGIMISNSLAGIAGYFVAQSSGFVDVGAGFGIGLFSITMLVLGKTLYVCKKPFSIWVPVLGVIAYCIIQQLLLKVGFNLKYFTMIQSGIVLLLLVYKYRQANRLPSSDNLGV